MVIMLSGFELWDIFFLDAKWGFKGLDRWAMISAWFGRWLLLKRIL